MAEIRFGHREGPGKGKEYPVAASQTFYRRGGKFVYLDASGAVCIKGSASTYATAIMGWAEIPKDAAGYSYWTSSSTAKKDKVFVITPTDSDIFEMPCRDTSLSASNIGKGAAIGFDGVNSARVQKANTTNVASGEVLTIVGVDNDNDTVLVRVKSRYLQTQ